MANTRIIFFGSSPVSPLSAYCPNETRFPYLLPNILGAVLAVMCLLLVFFFLEETLETRKGGDRYFTKYWLE